MMRLLGFAPLAVIVVGLLFGASARSQDLGEEWTALSAADAAIVFQEPSLDDKVERRLRTEGDGYQYTLEIAMWTGPKSPIPKALMYYHKLGPGYFFRNKLNPNDVPNLFEYFEDGEIEFAELRRTRNHLGQVKSQQFRFADVDCVSFVLQYGVSDDDLAGAGTARVYGYYCADPGMPLAEATADAVLGSIAIREKTAP